MLSFVYFFMFTVVVHTKSVTLKCDFHAQWAIFTLQKILVVLSQFCLAVPVTCIVYL